MNYADFPVLSLAIWVPVLSGLLVLLLGRKGGDRLASVFSLAGAFISLAVTLVLPFRFDAAFHGMQFVERTPWIRHFRIDYFLGVDGLSLWFIVLTAFITCMVVIAAWRSEKPYFASYLGAFLILSGLMTGVFCALDGALFYVFFEATLIPMFLLIGLWGGERRIYAAFKFFLYTFLGSLFMLIGVLYLYLQSGSFSVLDWHVLPLPLNIQTMLFLAFLLAFGVKVPMWPVHTWLPDAHVEAPTEGSVVLAAIMLKLGAYGFVRFMLPIAPDASRSLSILMITLSLVAVIYIALVALVQQDMKKLIAYSSIAHMGFVTLGFFLFQQTALAGGMVQMISHGFVSAALFFCIGVLYDRTHSRQIADYGGVVQTMPRFAALFVLFCMANLGLPGTSGFVGEFMVILSAVKYGFWVGLLAATALILGAAYTLWMVKRVVFGPVIHVRVKELTDISTRECLVLGILAVAVIGVGIYPAILTDTMNQSLQDLLLHVGRSKIL